ncbi:MAG: cellulase family glycosylhydrolase [Bradymonadales bacterium]|nr:cellulase family glycosylhydrolase [Bradymonadales bacterium]
MNSQAPPPDDLVQVDGRWFKDAHGRTRILRGANLGGTSKIPVYPPDGDLEMSSLLDWKQVSFLGRPFPLDQADEHFSRLKSWGFTFLRLVVTWEAIEHEGPGIYDQAYLDYLRAIVQRAGDFGISVFIDPHQDTWSRWSGGDGAPAWTLTSLGIALDRIAPTEAALLRQQLDRPFRRLAWPSNNLRYAAATLFTLFFAGNDFAPDTRVEGMPVQEFLQSHYIAAFRQVAQRVADLPNLVGFDSGNEPWRGLVGQRDCSVLQFAIVKDGVLPTPFEAMTAASGTPTLVDVYRMGLLGARRIGRQLFNPDGVRLFQDGFDCPWRQHGVWTDRGDKPVLLQPAYFATTRGGALADGSIPPPPGTEVDFYQHYLVPHIRRFIRELRAVRTSFTFFLNGIGEHPLPPWSSREPPNVAMAFHWYDGATLALKRYTGLVAYNTARRKMELGPRRSFKRQLAALVAQTRDKAGEIPPFVGEFGLPFDMNDKRAYRTGDFRAHERALAAYYDAIDANLLSSTIWNYSADNTNQRGDRWNDEDLSIFSRDQQHRPWTEDLDSGGRAVRGFCRPYAMRTAGTPLAMTFDHRLRRFEYRWRSEPSITAPTEVFVPPIQVGEDYRVFLHPSSARFEKQEEQRLLQIWGPREPMECILTITPGPDDR